MEKEEPKIERTWKEGFVLVDRKTGEFLSSPIHLSLEDTIKEYKRFFIGKYEVDVFSIKFIGNVDVQVSVKIPEPEQKGI